MANVSVINVLAIDDMPDNLVTLQAVLRNAIREVNIITTQNGSKGIELAKSENPDVILLDIIMPVLDGLAVCRLLKNDEATRHIPVIMITAQNTNHDLRQSALDAGADGFLTKPLDDVELVAQLKVMVKIKKAWSVEHDEKVHLSSLVLERTKAIESELEERRKAEAELQKANLRLNQTQSATLNLLGDLKREMEVRKQYETELVKAKEKAEESDRLKSAFLANMSHEVRTPMNGIIGFSGLLSDPDLDDAERNRYIKIINDNCQQLLHIVSDIIDISKIEAGMVEVETADFCLNDLMDSLLENYQPKAAAKGLKLTLQKGLVCEACSINGDQSKLRQILENLLTNALKFTEKGAISFGYQKIRNDLHFFVHDSGIGIAPEHQAAIFNRFWQVETGLARQFGGTGLGLSISKAYISSMEGDIHVESEPGKGAHFHFNIPYRQSGSLLKATLTEPSIPFDLTRKCILVVEDEEYNFEFLEILLSRLGVKFLHAWNGSQALELFREHPEIDLVLMDFKLPDISGQEITGRLLDLRPGTPVIATTAYAMSGDREKAIQSGCVDYLSKPIKAEELTSTLRKHLI